jgi:hypothetical protein
MLKNTALGYVIAFYNETVIDRFVKGGITRRVPHGYTSGDSTYSTLLPLAEFTPYITVFFDPALEDKIKESGAFDLIKTLSDESMITYHHEMCKQFKGRWRLMQEMTQRQDAEYLFIVEDDFVLNKLNYDTTVLDNALESGKYDFISLNRNYSMKATEAEHTHSFYGIPMSERGMRDGFIVRRTMTNDLFEYAIKHFFKEYKAGNYKYHHIHQWDDCLWVSGVKHNPQVFSSVVYEGTIPLIHAEFYSKSARSSFVRNYEIGGEIAPLESFLQELIVESHVDFATKLYGELNV